MNVKSIGSWLKLADGSDKNKRGPATKNKQTIKAQKANIFRLRKIAPQKGKAMMVMMMMIMVNDKFALPVWI